MIKKIIAIAACFQAAISVSAQTEDQKQMIYEQINRDSRIQGIAKKIDPIENKEALFNKAQVIPIYKVDMQIGQNPKLLQNKNYYLIVYMERFYVFMDNKTTRLVENNTLSNSILEFNEKVMTIIIKNYIFKLFRIYSIILALDQ